MDDATPAPEPDDAPPAPAPVDALVAAACGKAGLVWVTAAQPRPAPLWHVWHEGAVLVVVGGGEQPDPVGDAAQVSIAVPSKDNRARLLTVRARVEPVLPGQDGWEPATFALAAQRLNTSTSVDQPAVWARESRVLRLVPEPGAALVEGPGSYDDGSGAAPVPASPATTTTWHPFHLRGRRRRRFRL